MTDNKIDGVAPKNDGVFKGSNFRTPMGMAPITPVSDNSPAGDAQQPPATTPPAADPPVAEPAPSSEASQPSTEGSDAAS